MNIQVVLLSVVLTAFVGLWSNDQPGERVAAVSTPTQSYRPMVPMSAAPTDATMRFTSESVTPLEVSKLPPGIAAGTYQVVNHLGDVNTLTISISDLGQQESQDPRDLYLLNENSQRWYFIRIDEAVVQQTKTAVIPDGPVLK
jgi:hypothetical protein